MSSSFLPRALLAFGATALALALCGAYYYSKAWHQYGLLSVPGVPSVRDTRLGFVPQPGMRSYRHGKRAYQIFTDSRGARIGAGDPEIAPAHAEVLAAGCSFTFGLWVNAEETFTGRLAARLARRVYNIGVNGYGTLGSLLRTEDFLDLRPRVVVYSFIEDHLARNVAPCASATSGWCEVQPYLAPGSTAQPEVRYLSEDAGLPREATDGGAHPFGWRDLAWAVKRDWKTAIGHDRAGLNAAALRGSAPDFPEQALRYSLDRWLKLAHERGFELVVAYIPDLARPVAEGVGWRVLRSYRGQPRFQLIDLTPALAPHAAGRKLCLTAEDCHPSPLAHDLIARTLAAELSSLLGKGAR
jgi:hypothetical protein